MTTDELKAAAERLLACNGELEWKEQYEGNENHDFNDDVDDVAECFLARLAADEQQAKEDAEPITEEWLRFCMDQEYEGTFSNQSMTLGCICQECGRYGWCWIIGNVRITHLETRGQLRKLLEALKGGE